MQVTGTSGTLTFLLVDECPISRAGMRDFLRYTDRPKVVGEASSAEETIRLATELQPDFVVIDPEFSAKENSGSEGQRLDSEVCRELKNMPNSPYAIAYTGHDHPAGVAALMLSGIDGYVHKSTPREQLEEVREIVRREGRPWMPGPLTGRIHIMEKVINYASRLSPREEQVYELVLKRYSNSEIADSLYISLQTVKNHLGSIFRKCETANRKELFKRVFG